jgi:predicted esterase
LGTIFVHAKDDPIIPWQQSEAMAQALKEANAGWVETYYFSAGGHDLPSAQTITAMDTLFKKRCD